MRHALHRHHIRTAFWWNARPNFGDRLTPVLLERFAGISVDWAEPGEADIVAAGSVLDLLPTHWTGTVFGTGKLHERTVPDLRHARVLALRGRLTAHHAKHSHRVALGDPALLCSEMIEHPAKEHNLVVVPHWSDGELAKRFAHLDPHVVPAAGDPMEVITEIAKAKKVVSSSLHGIIVADSFRIPRRLERHPHINKPYEGGDFKFRDYASVFDGDPHFGELHMPDERKLEVIEKELFDAFAELRKHI